MPLQSLNGRTKKRAKGAKMKSKCIWLLALMIGYAGAQNIDISGTWYLQALIDNGIQKNTQTNQKPAFVLFEGNKSAQYKNNGKILTPSQKSARMNGSAGCNQFFAQYILNGNIITFAYGGMTRMLCANEEMFIESALMKILSDGSSQVRFNDDELILQRGQTEAIFRR